MTQIIYCTMCLGVKMKMFIMNSEMIRIYNDILIKEIEPCQEKMYACFECAHLLHKYEVFKTKCRKAFNIISSLKLSSFEATEEMLNNIDRKQNKLESKLGKCITSNHYQFYHQNQLCNSVNASDVKTELILVDTEQNNGPENHLQDVLCYATTDPITLDSSSHQSTLSDTVAKLTSTGSALKNIDHSLNILKTEFSRTNKNIYKDCVSNERTRNDTELKTTDESINNYVSMLEIKLEVKSESLDFTSNSDRNSDSDCATLDECPIKVENKISKLKKSTVKKRKYNVTSKKEDKESCDKGSKRKRGIKEVARSEMVSGTQIKNLRTKASNRNRKRNRKVRDTIKKESDFSIDSSIFKEYMTIVELSRDDAMKELLLRKESKNYKTKPHKCDLCNRGFNSAATYQTHMKKHSVEYGTLKCDICQLNFLDKRLLIKHRVLCHTWKFLCKICPYICFGTGQARAHIHSHRGRKYTCKDCGEIFRFPNSLSAHMRFRHSIEVVCDLCGSTCASTKGLDIHKRLVHKEEKNEHLGPQCVECDVHFASELAWKRHLVLVSRHQVQHGCGVCGEALADAASLRAHLRQHGPMHATGNLRARVNPQAADAGPAAQPCGHCDAEFVNKKEYQIHLASEHPGVDADAELRRFADAVKWVCEVCGKIFKFLSVFTKHQFSHTGETPYGCGECGKRFKREDSARAHSAVHTGQYAFQCDVCDRRYADRAKLNRHRKRHLGHRPYKCAYCDKSFLYPSVANEHAKYVHGKEPYPKRDRSKKSSVTSAV